MNHLRTEHQTRHVGTVSPNREASRKIKTSNPPKDSAATAQDCTQLSTSLTQRTLTDVAFESKQKVHPTSRTYSEALEISMRLQTQTTCQNQRNLAGTWGVAASAQVVTVICA